MAIWPAGTWVKVSKKNDSQDKEKDPNGEDKEKDPNGEDSDNQDKGEGEEDEEGKKDGDEEDLDGDGKGNGEEDEEDHDGDGKGDGEDDEEDGDGSDDDDAIAKDIEDRLARKKEYDPNADDSDTKVDDNDQVNKINKTGGAYHDVPRVPAPAFSWKELIRQFVNTASRVEPTYAKINRRAATAASGVAVTGRGAIKPGERVENDGYKMFVAFDTSGSMWNVAPSTMALIEKLIAEKEGDIQGIFGVALLGHTVPEFYAADLQSKKAWKIPGFSAIMSKPPAITFPISGLFTKMSGGGHELPVVAANEMSAALSAGYNVLLLTDSDVSYGSNLKNLKELVKKHPKGLFLILKGPQSYQQLVKELGQHNWITHLGMKETYW